MSLVKIRRKQIFGTTCIPTPLSESNKCSTSCPKGECRIFVKKNKITKEQINTHTHPSTHTYI